MGAWGMGLYSGDFALDLKSAISAVSRLPLDEEGLVDAICQSEPVAAANPADEDHGTFWLVVADQFEKRQIFSRRVREAALAIIDGGKDAAMMQALGMKPADLRKRAQKLAELRTRLIAQPAVSAARKTIGGPQPYVFERHGVYAYPTRRGEPINPYMSAKYYQANPWQPDGVGLILILDRGRAFDYLPWYTAVRATAVAPAVPDRAAAASDVRWTAPGHGSCNEAHSKRSG